MWWRLTRAIIVSWLIGVMCGAVGVVLLEQQNRTEPGVSTAPAVSAGDQSAPQTSGTAPGSAGQNE
jgi:hypothetical protein